MNYEEQITELKRRIEFLENEEKKRISKKKIKIAFEISKILIIFILFGMIYFSYIKPIKDKIDYVEDKISNVEIFIDEKISLLDKFNLFS